jgi:multisubunit Na+/H+ antiporter MnhE subunit
MKKKLLIPFLLIDLFVFYVIQVIKSNFIIAWDILTPAMKTNPGTIKHEVDLMSKQAVLMYSNLVSMTPGTIATDYCEETSTFDIHVLYKQNEPEIITDLLRIERKISRLIQ